MRYFKLIVLLLVPLIASCKQKTGSAGGSKEPQSLIVGHWSGHAINPPGKDGKSAPSLDFEYEFRADGTFRMGKRKVWIEGTYRFLDARRFEMHIKQADVGPYEIVESTPTRLVYERKLDANRTQRTELTRMQ